MDPDLELFLMAEDLKKEDAEKLKFVIDLKAKLRPPEQEAIHIMEQCQNADQAFFVAEHCMNTMAKVLENGDVVDYWRKVCEFIKPHTSKN